MYISIEFHTISILRCLTGCAEYAHMHMNCKTLKQLCLLKQASKSELVETYLYKWSCSFLWKKCCFIDPPPRWHSGHRWWFRAWHWPMLRSSWCSHISGAPGVQQPRLCWRQSFDPFGWGTTNTRQQKPEYLQVWSSTWNNHCFTYLQYLHIALLHEQVPKGSRHCEAPKQAASTKGGRTRRENTPHALQLVATVAARILHRTIIPCVF